MNHVHADVERLIAHAVGSLSAREDAEVVKLIDSCEGCASEAAAWQVIALGTRAASARLQPSSESLAGLLERVAGNRCGRRVVITGQLGHAWAVVAGQVPLVRRGIWAASVLMLALGAAIAISRHDRGGAVLALIAPVAAALGVSLIYGPEVDPGAEIEAASPTSSRLILLARLSLVGGFNLCVALAATGVVAIFGSASGFWSLVSAWFGPFALLSAVSLLLSVWKGPIAGSVAALTLWGLGVLARAGDAGLLSAGQASALEQLWSTSAAVLIAAGLLVACAVFAAPYRIRLA